MQTALRLTARVQADHKLEIIAPELTEVEEVDIFVVMPETSRPSLEENPCWTFSTCCRPACAPHLLGKRLSAICKSTAIHGIDEPLFIC